MRSLLQNERSRSKDVGEGRVEEARRHYHLSFHVVILAKYRVCVRSQKWWESPRVPDFRALSFVPFGSRSLHYSKCRERTHVVASFAAFRADPFRDSKSAAEAQTVFSLSYFSMRRPRGESFQGRCLLLRLVIYVVFVTTRRFNAQEFTHEIVVRKICTFSTHGLKRG